jgi:pimeloyl-ACP methyl ester carboxylesterase
LKKKLKIVAGLLLVAAFAFVLFAWHEGTVLIAPSNCEIGKPPANLPVQAIQFQSSSGATVHGWLLSGQPGKGVVILMHGIRANRLQLVDHAEFLFHAGYSVLLFDFQAHGESIGRHITAGYLESRDAAAAVDFVRQKFPGEKVCQRIVDGRGGGCSGESSLASQRHDFGIGLLNDSTSHYGPFGSQIRLVGEIGHAVFDVADEITAGI